MINKLNNFKFKHACTWLDEIVVVLVGVFIVGVLFHVKDQNQKIHELTAEQSAMVNHLSNKADQANRLAEKRLDRIEKLDQGMALLQETVAQQNKAIEELTQTIKRGKK